MWVYETFLCEDLLLFLVLIFLNFGVFIKETSLQAYTVCGKSLCTQQGELEASNWLLTEEE